MLGRSVYNVHFVLDCTLTFIHLLSLAQAQKMPKLCQFASDLLLKQKLNSYIGNLWTSKIANILNKVVKCNECLSVIWLFNLGWTNDGSTWTIVEKKLKPLTSPQSSLFLIIPLSVSPEYLNGNVLKCTSQGAKADLFSQDLQICFTWNIFYFEHNPPYIHTIFLSICLFLF